MATLDRTIWKKANARSLYRLCLMAALIAGAACVQGNAQTITGSISGTVKDASGAVVPSSEVEVVNADTGERHATRSNGSGNYIFPALPPGRYTLTSASTGFGTETRRGVVLTVNGNAHVDFSLAPGTSTETVTVSSGAEDMDTTESQLGQTIDQRKIEDLPLNGRSAYGLVLLSPGISSYSAPAVTGSYNGVLFSTNGLRNNDNSFYLDGSYDTSYFRNSGNLIPNPDALQEFRVLTSNFDAEFGRLPGSVVNIITRSGTNTFHGLAYDYLRNNDLNARQEFVSGISPLKQNQFGATFGGPVFRNRVFFFTSYEGLRIAAPVTITAGSIVTPTPAQASGDFSALAPSKYPKMANGQVYSCNGKAGVICSNLLDPVAQNALKYVPPADSVTGITPQQRTSGNSTANQGLGRVDAQLTPSNKLSFTLFMQRGLALTPTAGSNQILSYSGTQQDSHQTNIVLNDSWILSPNKLNNINLSFTRNHTTIANIFNGHYLADLGSQISEGAPLRTQPGFSITGYFAMGSTSSSEDNKAQQSIAVFDDFLWTHENHQFKLGGTFVWAQYADTGVYQGSTISTFTGSTTGNALADFLLGNANSMRQNSGIHYRLHGPAPALYAQDNYRVSHRLTLNLGARWEIYVPMVAQNNFATFVPNRQSTRFPTAPLGLVFSGDPGIPNAIFHTKWNDVAPRVGFAYDARGNGTTVLRGGYGIFYAALQGGLNENLQQQPFALDLTINKTPNLVNPYGAMPDPFPYVVSSTSPTFQSGATIAAIPPDGNSSTPYVQEYNLNVEQQIGKGWLAQIAYVGNTGRKRYFVRDENSPVYIPGASTSTAGLNGRRPYQPTPLTYVYGGIYELDPAGNSSYNALQLTLSHRFEHHFSVLANYTWAKNIDIVTGYAASISGSQLTDDNNPARDRGLSGNDLPHSFVGSFSYEIVPLKHWGLIGRDVLGGWQMNAIVNLQSGTPINITSGVDSNLNGVNNDRPNLVGVPYLSSGRSRGDKAAKFFNTAAFAQVPSGTPYGNVPRNFLFGPGYANVDFSMFKNIALWREHRLQVRGEFFNFFNHVNLGNPNGTLTSAKFGTISTAGSPRILQVAMKYSF